MAEFSFEVDSILDNGMLCGRNSICEIPAGFVFKRLKKIRFEGDISDPSSIDLGVVALVNLCITEVHCFHRVLPAIPSKYTACLVVDGTGYELLKEEVSKRQNDECLYLTE